MTSFRTFAHDPIAAETEAEETNSHSLCVVFKENFGEIFNGAWSRRNLYRSVLEK